MTKSVGERELVLEILLEVLEKGAYGHIVLRNVLSKYQYLDKRERAFITRVSEGTIERVLELDYILDQFSKVRVRKMKPVIRNILRSAVYQLKYMDTVPDSAVCNEAVLLAVKKGFGNLRGFVNGVLRNVARGLGSITYPEDELQRLSVSYSMPEWILKLWLEEHDKKTVEKMLAAFQTERPLTIRCNLKRIDPDGLREKLEKDGVKVKRHPYLSYAFIISGYDYLERLSGFADGDFYVQDVSSMLVGEAVGARAGDVVIDVCAAPGGKSLHLAEKLDGTGCVEARDLTSYKVELIEDNIARSGLENVSARVWDALSLDESAIESADIVLADLPCSGLGVLGKKADLKYRVTLEDVEELAKLQRNILKNIGCYVKYGGTLVYSTCTISQVENIGNVRWFLENFPEFELANVWERLPAELAGKLRGESAEVTASGLLGRKSNKPRGESRDALAEKCLQLLPGVHACDGFFIAVFRKCKKSMAEVTANDNGWEKA